VPPVWREGGERKYRNHFVASNSDAVVGREPLAAMKNSNLVSVLIYHRTSVTPVPVCRPRQSRRNKPSRCGVGCCSALQSLNAAQMRTLMSKKSFPSAERRQIARLPQGVHRVRVQQQAVETTLKGDCELRVRKMRQQNISQPAHRQHLRCDTQRFTARPVLSDELGFEQLQHVRVLGAAMPAICAAPHARTPAREVTNRLSRI